MTRLFQPAISITVEADEDGYPQQFRWQARTHQVKLLDQYWQIDTGWWTPTGRASRTYFALITQTGLLCVVYRDELADIWYLSTIYD